MPRIPAIRAGYLSCRILVASPPSSSTMLGVQPCAPRRVCSMHHSYSSSLSPFQAKTGIPLAAIADAAWSWVEKMLHELQRIVAPSCIRVSISTAVWIVMCRQPTTRAPHCPTGRRTRSPTEPGEVVAGNRVLGAKGRLKLDLGQCQAVGLDVEMARHLDGEDVVAISHDARNS